MRTGVKRHIAYALIGLALASHGRADPGWSARVHGAADQAFADLGHAFEPFEGGLADLDRQRLRIAMGAEAFDDEYAAGRTLDPAQVLAAARALRTQRPGSRGWRYQVRPRQC